MPAISIVIPVYNVERYLRQSLDSIIAQTFTDFEAICVNDGSSDKSLDILREYALIDSRFKVLSQENSGAGSARNNGFKNSTGKYVIFLDADDYFEPQLLEVLYSQAEFHGADISVCSSKKVDDDGNITETRNPNSPLNLAKLELRKTFNYRDFPKDIFSLVGTIPWNKLYLREMLVKNNLKFPALVGPDDLCFVQMANACAEKIVATDEELINYRYNRPGSVQTYRANHTIDIIRAFLFIKDFLIEKRLFEKLQSAYKKALVFSVRWEISLCNDEQYQNFLKELKLLFPNDWKDFEPALKKDYITLDYLYNIIGDKKVYFWGASIFLQNLLDAEFEKKSNILGIIDKNEASWGRDFCGYKIFPPEVLKTNPANILVTVYNNPDAYLAIKSEVEEKYAEIKVLDNIIGELTF